MTESKAMILGCSGLVLTEAERAFFGAERPWGFILFARNIESAEQIRRLTADLRAAVGRPDAPVLIDQEGGRVQRIRAPIAGAYPPAAALGALYREDVVRGLRAAWLMSRLHAFDLMRLGIDVDCLPVLDVPFAGAHDVIGNRAYADDPAIVSAMGQAAAQGLRAGGMLPVVKHMPGHGRAGVDSHKDLPVVSAARTDLEARDFRPFIALKHEAMAMTAHVVFTAIDPERPATTSPTVIREVIRGLIGFDGLLMSDDASMNALEGTLGERTGAILAAGCDMVLHCNGDMAEMVEVAARTPVLSGLSASRASAALASRRPPDDDDEAALRSEFAEMMVAA